MKIFYVLKRTNPSKQEEQEYVNKTHQPHSFIVITNDEHTKLIKKSCLKTKTIKRSILFINSPQMWTKPAPIETRAPANGGGPTRVKPRPGSSSSSSRTRTASLLRLPPSTPHKPTHLIEKLLLKQSEFIVFLRIWHNINMLSIYSLLAYTDLQSPFNQISFIHSSGTLKRKSLEIVKRDIFRRWGWSSKVQTDRQVG